MGSHGHARSELRNLHLHRAAFEKLRVHPELRRECLELVERWLTQAEQRASARSLAQWREMLSSWPVERIAAVVLDRDGGQTLRQCSPLAPTLTPRERWVLLDEANRLPIDNGDTERT